ncbi:MarR family transcriptional regulator [Streptomyces sp. NPDC002671]
MTPTAQRFDAPFMDASELHDLLLRSKLKQGADLKVLMYYATAVPTGEPVPTTATDIGKQLGLSTTSASRSIGRLAQQGWLQHAYTAIGIKFYRLGPNATHQNKHPDTPDPTEQPLAAVHHLHPHTQP